MEEDEERVEVAERGVVRGLRAEVEHRETESQEREEMLSVLIMYEEGEGGGQGWYRSMAWRDRSSSFLLLLSNLEQEAEERLVLLFR